MAKYKLQMTVPIAGNTPDADFGDDADLRSSILSKGGVVHRFIVLVDEVLLGNEATRPSIALQLGQVAVNPAQASKMMMANSWSGVPLISSFGGASLQQYTDDGLSSQPIGEIDGDPYVAVTKLQSERAGRGFGVNAPPIDQEYMRELLHSGLPHLDRPHGYPGSSAGNSSDHWMMFVCFLYAVIFVTAVAFALISWKFQKNRNEAWDCEQKIEWDTEVEKAEEAGDEEGGGEGFEAGEGGA